jgi:hypothetical protein
MLRVLQMTVPLFFTAVIFSDRSWCLYFDTTDSYLRFIPTNGQMTVLFYFWVVIFPVIVGVRILTRQTVLQLEKITTGKKGTVVWSTVEINLR